MSFLAAVRVALAALLNNKARSALTSLGIVIGIGAVIALVSAGEGARQTLDDRLDSIGKSIILIRPGARTQQGTLADIKPLAQDDAAVIRKRVGPLLIGTSELQMAQRVVSSRFAHWNTVLVGSTPQLQQVRNWKIAQGRFYNDDDMKKMAPVCLLGATTKHKLFPDRADVVGQTLRVDHLRLRVIGVTMEKGRSPTGADQDDLIFVPITTLQRKLVGDDHISLILCAARSENEIDTARDEIDRVLRERRRLKAGQPNDFDVSSVREMSELAVILTATLQLLTAVIASISLLVGGIGIMNIMLVSVTERDARDRRAHGDRRDGLRRADAVSD